MNIVVQQYGSSLCYCRPDTTWEKEGRDLYIPEGIEKVLWAPVVYAKISKAGKCVSKKFISRYYDAVGCGLLAYSDDSAIAYSSCMDHTSLLPVPTLKSDIFESEDCSFRVEISGEGAEFKFTREIRERLENAICLASERVSLRIGDLVAIELSPLKVLAERNTSETSLMTECCGEKLFELKVIF
jgi:hypothetical protein